MRGVWIKVFTVCAIAVAACGCQSPGSINALGPSGFAGDVAANSEAPPSIAMPAGAPAIAPPGFVGFCLRMQDQCDGSPDGQSVVAATPAVWQTLNRVNAQVNAAIAPETDEDHYGRGEYWTIPTDGYGDCEDYALAKRKALIEAGLPMDALRVAVVRLWDGERHAVLTVSTTKGDYVLDSLEPAILPWTKVSYTWVERQTTNPWNWAALGDVSSGELLARAAEDAKAQKTARLEMPSTPMPQKVAFAER
jgi:predicted transglutaminase-like cysteine proteinase